MPDQVYIAVPCPSIDDGDRADRPVNSIGGGNVVSIWRPRAPSKISGKRRGFEWMRDSLLEHEVISLIMRSRIRAWRLKAPDLNAPIITGSGEIFIRWIERETLDVTLVADQCLELLKCVPRPDNDLRIKPDGYQN